MRHILFLLFAALTLQAFAQYPATGNKARLGWQTTGDGLVYRGAIGDTTTLDPSGLNNAWMLLDTASGNLYAYRTKAWRLVSGGGGGGLTMPFDSVTFNVNETDASLRELKYSEEKGYLQYGGQDSVQIPLLPGVWYVRNDTSVTIPKGTVVRASGTLGASGRIKVKHMIANGSIDAMYILGIAMHDIAVGADGYAMSQGKIRQVNTQAYSEGAVLYADVDTLGGLTQTEPGNGFLKLPIAFVVHSASNGVLAVRITSGAYMRDLHDVEVTSPATNASLYYNTAQGIWRDTTGAVLTSDTSVFARDFQISGTADYLAKFTGSNTVGDANIKEVVGNTSSEYVLRLGTNSDANTLAYLGNRLILGRTNSDAYNYYADNPTNDYPNLAIVSGVNDDTLILAGRKAGASINKARFFVRNSTDNAIALGVASDNATTFHVSQPNSGAGNVGINTTTPAYRLDVNGDVNTTGMYKKSGTDIISGTTNYLPKFTGTNTIGNSGFIENGQEVYLGGTTNAFNFSRFSIYYNPVNNGFPIVADTRAYNSSPLPGSGWNFGGKKDSTGVYTAFAAIQGAKETSANSEAGYLQFSTNGDGGSAFPEERMRITSEGNVGIATSSPGSYLLNLRDSIGFSGNGMYFSSTNGGTANPGGYIIGTKLGNWGTRLDIWLRDAGGSLTERAVSITGGGGAGGSIGINTASPSRPLHVAGTTAIRIPSGNFSQRGTSDNGDIRVRTDTASMEYYSGAWRTVAPMARVPQSGLANRFSKFDANGLLDTSAVLIQNGSNIGIGTSSATNLLTIKSQSTSDIPVSVRSSAASNINIVALSESNGAGAISLKDKNGNTDIVLNTDITAFNISNDTTPPYIIATSYSPTSGNGPEINLSRARGTEASPSAVSNGDELGEINFSGRSTSGGQFTAAIRALADSVVTSRLNTGLAFYTGATTATLTERMRINSKGNVGIGNSPAITDSALTVTGGIRATRDVYARRYNVSTFTGQVLSINNFAPTGAPGANVWIGNGGQSSAWATGDEGSYNVGIGIGALESNTSGRDNVANGALALQRNTTGYANIANGRGALNANISGYSNIANGTFALLSNTTGIENVANGVQALFSNLSGSYNIANGVGALNANTTGSGNVANGRYALLRNNGDDNVANGASAMSENTTGHSNVAEGTQALLFNTTGNGNVAIGFRSGVFTNAGASNQTSNYSIYVGYGARASASGNTSEIVIGYEGRGNGSNTTTIGNSSTTATILPAGNLGIAITSTTARLHLPAGTATANTAPLKFTSGTNLTTPEAGAVEWNGTNVFVTNSSATRQTVNQGLTGSATIDFASTNAQNSRDATITVTGAADGDVVSLGVPNAAVNANTCYTAWVSAANTVTVRFNNYSSGAVDPASATFKVFVTKF